MAAIISASWYSFPSVAASHIVAGLVSEAKEYGRRHGVSLLRSGHKRHCSFYWITILFLLDHLIWEKLNAMLWAARLGGPCGKELWPPANSQEETESSRKRLYEWIWEWMQITKVSVTSWGLGTKNLRARTHPARILLNSDPLENNKWLFFKLLGLGVIFMQHQITKTTFWGYFPTGLFFSLSYWYLEIILNILDTNLLLVIWVQISSPNLWFVLSLYLWCLFMTKI